jgi:hypothetical protein
MLGISPLPNLAALDSPPPLRGGGLTGDARTFALLASPPPHIKGVVKHGKRNLTIITPTNTLENTQYFS